MSEHDGLEGLRNRVFVPTADLHCAMNAKHGPVVSWPATDVRQVNRLVSAGVPIQKAIRAVAEIRPPYDEVAR